jgi:hypothetical protein
MALSDTYTNIDPMLDQMIATLDKYGLQVPGIIGDVYNQSGMEPVQDDTDKFMDELHNSGKLRDVEDMFIQSGQVPNGMAPGDYESNQNPFYEALYHWLNAQEDAALSRPKEHVANWDERGVDYGQLAHPLLRGQGPDEPAYTGPLFLEEGMDIPGAPGRKAK